ncbi:MAG TPA: hypothetical protein VMB80_04120 [Candidatus Acidoferrum sp.]|nr:hypothetical protein [Candidatus Acidoferrum sp.]
MLQLSRRREGEYKAFQEFIAREGLKFEYLNYCRKAEQVSVKITGRHELSGCEVERRLAVPEWLVDIPSTWTGLKIHIPAAGACASLNLQPSGIRL